MASSQTIIDGLMYLQTFGDCNVAAEHDIFYAGYDLVDNQSPRVVEKMEALGWFWDEEVDCWAVFV